MDAPSQRERLMPSVPIKAVSTPTIVWEAKSSVELMSQVCYIARAEDHVSADLT
jgi:hypothetical protein